MSPIPYDAPSNDSIGAAVSASSYNNNVTTTASGVLAGMALICVLLRFWMCIRVRKSRLGSSDWWILAALLLMLTSSAMLLAGTIIDPNPEELVGNAYTSSPLDIMTNSDTLYVQLSFVCSFLYFANVASVKISVLLLYRRIFGVKKVFRNQSLSVGIAVAIWWFSAEIANLMNCQPLWQNWASLTWNTSCFDYNTFCIATGALEVLLDTTILILPIKSILELQQPWKRRAWVLMIFLLGIFVIITGILRVINGFPRNGPAPSLDRAELWSTIHVGMSVICACLPSFAAPVGKLLHGKRLSFSRGKSTRKTSVGSKGIFSHEPQTSGPQLPPVGASIVYKADPIGSIDRSIESLGLLAGGKCLSGHQSSGATVPSTYKRGLAEDNISDDETLVNVYSDKDEESSEEQEKDIADERFDNNLSSIT